jgi:valyl-tRNA synthetase
MESRYDFSQLETKMYQAWEEAQAFAPVTSNQKDTDSTTKPFTIIMPPPNANDPLHIGHAMFVSLEDIMIRYHRMKGDDTLWLPGTDHAGIETQFVFEKKLRKKKQSRFNFDRETLYQMIWDYVQENSGVAVDQMKKIGASADWDRFKFMLEPEIVEIVLDTFTELREKGLIYRDLKLVNYCTKCGTSFSELEVEHQDETATLYTIAYGPVQVSTVRPETLFGDVAIAVHPDDKRYQDLIGTKIEAEFPWGKVTLPVIADEYVKTDFGTGALKITPHHDPNDWDVWQRHQQEVPEPKTILATNGKLINVPEKYLGLNVNQGRKQVVADLKEAGVLIKEEKYDHNVGHCYRCKRTIEPLPLPQFFIKVKPLVEPVLEALDKGEIKVHGAGHDKILRHWLTNLKDWNISRQIVWGIRMPVWYQSQGYEDQITVGYLKDGKFTSQTLEEALKENSWQEITENLQELTAGIDVPYTTSSTLPQEDGQWIQETDTFDTWFSSSQWPFTTLMAGKNGDFERFYPTSVMETAYDILMFWVMRMLMMGKFKTGKFPFADIYLHGLIRDQKGQKMSKSKGNVVNPLEIIEKYGADSLRMALVIRSSAGLDKNVSESDFKAMRNLGNKIWNATRFILMNQPENDSQSENQTDHSPAPLDEKFNQQLSSVVQEITQQLEDLKLGLAAETVYNHFWHWFCDEAIEQAKQGKISQKVLLNGLQTFLKLLHPFVPFVTEAVWQELPKSAKDSELLITSSWPQK